MLAIDVLESLMISVQDKRPGLKVMTLMSQFSYNSIELLVTSVVVVS